MGLMPLILIAMFAIFYFLMIRPQRQRQKDHQFFIESIEPGDLVITAGGICGEIDEVNELDVILMVEDGVRLKLLKSSIMAKQRGEEDSEEVFEDDEIGEDEEVKELE